MHVSAFGWDNRRLFHVACEVGVGTYGSKDVLYMLGSGLGNPVNALVGSARRTISSTILHILRIYLKHLELYYSTIDPCFKLGFVLELEGTRCSPQP
jgi:sulfopyruvate decarboxylase TPP-binding subunit